MNKTKLVVYIDDDEDDLEIFEAAFSSIDNAPRLKTFRLGEDALQYLKAQKRDEVFCYLLIDINLRIIDGFELLQALKEEVSFENIHVSFITTSHSAREMKRAAEIGVELLTKPSHIEGIEQIVRAIANYCNSFN